MPLFFSIVKLFAEDKKPTENLLWPMELRVPITGSFSEYRNHSLHLGCDFKTYWINGFPVRTLFDGYIHKMSYSDYGYGLSLVLYSPKKKMYARIAHLNDLKGDIKGLETLKEALLLLSMDKSFRINLKPSDITFEQGKRIARTGETGSGISHLHLELFNSQGFINPLKEENYKQNDIHPPEILSVYIDSDSGKGYDLDLEKSEEGRFGLTTKERPVLKGKIKFRIAGYDLITAQNKNGIYGIRAEIEDREVFSQNFEEIPYKYAYTRGIFYDTNRSSLDPPHYVYKLFDKKTGKEFSYDLSGKEGKDIKVKLNLLDAYGNVSGVTFLLHVSNTVTVKTQKKKSYQFNSIDKNLSLNFSEAKVKGDGKIEINKFSTLPQNFQSDKFIQASEAYEIRNIDFFWQGKATGFLKGNFQSAEEDIYLYMTGIKSWVKLRSKKKKGGIEFQLPSSGYVAIMKDRSPPSIMYPYLLYRDYNLEGVIPEGFIERFYLLSESGSGVKQIEVLFEGKKYPYEYDRDRKFIKVLIPKSIKMQKKIFLIQLRAKDFAGNHSEWFTDILTFL